MEAENVGDVEDENMEDVEDEVVQKEELKMLDPAMVYNVGDDAKTFGEVATKEMKTGKAKNAAEKLFEMQVVRDAGAKGKSRSAHQKGFIRKMAEYKNKSGGDETYLEIRQATGDGKVKKYTTNVEMFAGLYGGIVVAGPAVRPSTPPRVMEESVLSPETPSGERKRFDEIDGTRCVVCKDAYRKGDEKKELFRSTRCVVEGCMLWAHVVCTGYSLKGGKEDNWERLCKWTCMLHSSTPRQMELQEKEENNVGRGRGRGRGRGPGGGRGGACGTGGSLSSRIAYKTPKSSGPAK